MGRVKKNAVHSFYSYDKTTNKCKCLVSGCSAEIKGNHGTNLVQHIARKHEEVFKIVQSRNEEGYSKIKTDRMSIERRSNENDSDDSSFNDLKNKLNGAHVLEFHHVECDDQRPSSSKKQCYEYDVILDNKSNLTKLNMGRIPSPAQPGSNGNSTAVLDNSQLWNMSSNFTAADLFGRIVSTELSNIDTMDQYDCMKDILEVLKKYQQKGK